MNVTYGGTPGGVDSIFAVMDPIAGYCSAAVGLLPVVMNTVPGPCDGIVWARLRTTLTLSATAAILGRCSENWTPRALVSIDLNSPRIPSGASGLLSHMSMV